MQGKEVVLRADPPAARGVWIRDFPEDEAVGSDDVAWLALGVLILAGVVAGAAVSRRARHGTASGFPWFWIALPATCIAAAAAVAVFAWPHVLSGSGSYWWEPAYGESARPAVLVERAVSAVRDVAPVEMGATCDVCGGDWVVRVGLARPPRVSMFVLRTDAFDPRRAPFDRVGRARCAGMLLRRTVDAYLGGSARGFTGWRARLP